MWNLKYALMSSNGGTGEKKGAGAVTGKGGCPRYGETGEGSSIETGKWVFSSFGKTGVGWSIETGRRRGYLRCREPGEG